MNRIGTAYFERNEKARLFADLACAGEPNQARRDELLGRGS